MLHDTRLEIVVARVLVPLWYPVLLSRAPLVHSLHRSTVFVVPYSLRFADPHARVEVVDHFSVVPSLSRMADTLAYLDL
jgi:hypothetical protein